jgi:hypothetical protein
MARFHSVVLKRFIPLQKVILDLRILVTADSIGFGSISFILVTNWSLRTLRIPFRNTDFFTHARRVLRR